MQELTFEQVCVVSGGSRIRRKESNELQVQERNLEGGGGGSSSNCGAAEIAKRGYDAFFMVAGGLIGGALSVPAGGVGASAGTALGGIASQLAWEASKDEVIHALCQR